MRGAEGGGRRLGGRLPSTLVILTLGAAAGSCSPQTRLAGDIVAVEAGDHPVAEVELDAPARALDGAKAVRVRLESGDGSPVYADSCAEPRSPEIGRRIEFTMESGTYGESDPPYVTPETVTIHCD